MAQEKYFCTKDVIFFDGNPWLLCEKGDVVIAEETENKDYLKIIAIGNKVTGSFQFPVTRKHFKKML